MNQQLKSSLLGFVIGDAMGVPVEFVSREELRENIVTTMQGYGSHELEAGTWSDDTSMTLATMKSIVDQRAIDYKAIMNNFASWANYGEFTTDGKVFDMGITCRNAILNFERTKCNPIDAGLSDIFNNGNGSLMRMLPIALYSYYKHLNSEEVINVVNNTSSLTHGHEISRLGCYLYVKYVMFLLDYHSKECAYQKLMELELSSYSKETINCYSRVLDGTLQSLTLDEIESTGYVVHTLEASLWVVLHTSSFNQAIIDAVNLGNDTDTIGAITGSLAGLIYGWDELNTEWMHSIRNKEYLFCLINDFIQALGYEL
ncbi:ADP-ribosylglycohydrolase family protein [Bacillus massiliigorillae]|uniref:ADP-ribosylglycohydrolase family protein n=1 Tax=Bacillus massiliigorillae TaxID=1243664 RepID=UPI0005A999BF|nr:ADP-ribosylglycohydrolase family protein [Bacillus massiliigorillae]